MQTETMVYTHDAVFFFDTLTYSTPYISNNPRNHDSLAFVTDGTLGYEKQGRTIQIKQGQSHIQPRALQIKAVHTVAMQFHISQSILILTQALHRQDRICRLELFARQKTHTDMRNCFGKLLMSIVWVCPALEQYATGFYIR